MKLNRITANNVFGIKHVDVNLKAPVAVFAGPNGNGKSSLAQAVRMALAGKPSRVALKKDYDKLVLEGQKKGSVVVGTAEGNAEFHLPAGKHTGGIEGDAIQHVLDPSLFASMDEKARRRFLFELVGLKVGTDEVRKRLAQRNCDAQKIEAVLPLLRSGFPEAHEEAKRRATECRGEWKGITGETYGAQKADGWTAPAVALSPEETKEREKELVDSLDAADAVAAGIEQQTAVIGELNANEAAYKRDQAEINGLKQRAANLGRATDALNAANLQLLEQNGRVAKLRAAAGEGPQQDPVPCPHCGGALHIADGAVVAHQQVEFDAEAAAMLPAQEQALQMLERAVGNRQRDLDDAKNAQIALDSRTPLPEVTQGDMEAAKGKLDAMKGSKAELERTIAEVRAELMATQQAEAKTKAAAAAHANVVAWAAIADAFAPDGIPGDMLADALVPINSRLNQSAERSGWAPARIAPDMALTLGGRDHALLSESEQWRANAMFAEAVAHISDLRLLVLDRMDCLDVAGRGQFIDWMYALIDAGEIDTALVFATMKNVPDLQDMDCFWIENGAIAGKSVKAA